VPQPDEVNEHAWHLADDHPARLAYLQGHITLDEFDTLTEAIVGYGFDTDDWSPEAMMRLARETPWRGDAQ
jgi:hypothetical protein